MKIVSTDDLDKNLKFRRKKALGLIKEEASLEDLEKLRRDIEKQKTEEESVPTKCSACGVVWQVTRKKHVGNSCPACNRGLANDLGGKLIRMKKSEIDSFKRKQGIRGEAILKQMKETEKIKKQEFLRKISLGEL